MRAAYCARSIAKMAQVPSGSIEEQGKVWRWLLQPDASGLEEWITELFSDLRLRPVMPSDAPPNSAARALWLSEAALRAVGGELVAPASVWMPLVQLQEAQMSRVVGWPGPVAVAKGAAQLGPDGMAVLAKLVHPVTMGRAVELLPPSETADVVGRMVVRRYWERAARQVPPPPLPDVRGALSWLGIAVAGLAAVVVLGKERKKR